MSSNNSNSANLSLAERIRLSREQEERERRRRAQEALHRLQEQSSRHASAAPADASASASAAMSTVGREFVMRLNDVSVSGESARNDDDRVNTDARQQQTGSGDTADADADATGTDDDLQRRSLLEPEGDLVPARTDEEHSQQHGAEGGSVFSYAPSFASGAMTAISRTLSAVTGYTGNDEDDDGGNSLTSYEKNVAHVDGDPLAVIRKMDWTVRVDIWIIVMDKKTPEMEERNKVVKSVLDRNEYIEADWDIKRWCDESAKGRCENNTVFLRKNFNPLYLQRSLKGRKQLRGNSK